MSPALIALANKTSSSSGVRAGIESLLWIDRFNETPSPKRGQARRPDLPLIRAPGGHSRVPTRRRPIAITAASVVTPDTTMATGPNRNGFAVVCSRPANTNVSQGITGVLQIDVDGHVAAVGGTRVHEPRVARSARRAATRLGSPSGSESRPSGGPSPRLLRRP